MNPRVRDKSLPPPPLPPPPLKFDRKFSARETNEPRERCMYNNRFPSGPTSSSETGRRYREAEEKRRPFFHAANYHPRFAQYCTRVELNFASFTRVGGETELWPEERRHVYYNTEIEDLRLYIKYRDKRGRPRHTYIWCICATSRPSCFSTIAAANCKKRRAIAYRTTVIARRSTRFHRFAER